MEDGKHWWASRTIWANIIALVATISTVAGLDLGLNEAAQTSIVSGVMAVVNIVLRFTTSKPIKKGS